MRRAIHLIALLACQAALMAMSLALCGALLCSAFELGREAFACLVTTGGAALVYLLGLVISGHTQSRNRYNRRRLFS